MVVQNELEKTGLTIKHITLGEVELEKAPSVTEKKQLEAALVPLGFELIDDKKSR
ncbi:MAG: AraC family transcriptional regulator, partial [Bacteroidetes bacterium]|nr:AraC family transcriptional regulator [Bacteroidota bacterium]